VVIINGKAWRVIGNVVLQGTDCHQPPWPTSPPTLHCDPPPKVSSLLSLTRTLFLVMLLAAGSYFIHLDTRRLVLQPVERMVERVREMAEDPLTQANLRIGGAAGVGGAGAQQQQQQPSAEKKQVQLRLMEQQSVATAAGGGADGQQQRSALLQLTEDDSRGQVGFRAIVMEAGGGDRQQHAAAAEAAVRPEDVAVATRFQRCTVAAHKQAVQATKLLYQLITQWWRALQESMQRAAIWLRARRLAAALDASLLAGGEDEGQHETQLLENSVYKICALLAVGFGDAGAEVIAENIREGGDLNPMVPGKRTVSFWVG